MALYKIINITGLSFDVIGVILLFFNGSPISTLFEDGSEIVTVTIDPNNARIAVRKILIAKISLILIVLGFVLQIVSMFMK